MLSTTLRAKTDELLITFVQDGSSDGWPVVLSHGFPYDVHAFDEVVPHLVEHGARVIRPYLRGFGPTSFLASSSMRSGQQAALGRDLVHLLDALEIKEAIAAGFDWGGVASCVARAGARACLVCQLRHRGHRQATKRSSSGARKSVLVSASVSDRTWP